MNLANAKTTRTPQGGPYRRRTVVQQTADVDDPFSIHMRSALDRAVQGVRVSSVAVDTRPFKRVYEPGNPDANAEGYVMYPDINVVEEMANLMTAQRNFEANVTTVDAVKGMEGFTHKSIPDQCNVNCLHFIHDLLHVITRLQG